MLSDNFRRLVRLDCARVKQAIVIAVLSLLCASLTTPAPLHAQDDGKLDRRQYKSGVEMRSAFRPAMHRAGQSTVRIKCAGKDVALGVIVGSDGWILTKASEVKDQLTCHLADGRSFDAQLVGVYPRADVAMLRINATDLPVIAWATDPVSIGQWAITAGVGVDPVAVGIVSVPERRIPDPAVLGIILNREDTAARVRQVFPNSGADKAGMLANDVIMQIADRPVNSGDELIRFIQEFRPGDAVRVNLQRGQEVVELEVTLSAPPARSFDRNRFQNQLGGELSERNHGFERAFQHDSVLKPSDCGGPLVNLDGQAVGLNIARSGRTESYALPVPLVQRIIAEFKEGQHTPEPSEPQAQTTVTK